MRRRFFFFIFLSLSVIGCELLLPPNVYKKLEESGVLSSSSSSSEASSSSVFSSSEISSSSISSSSVSSSSSSLAAGELDPNFKTGMELNYSSVECIAKRSDGKILIGGLFYGIKNPLLIDSNGSIDNNFNSVGIGANNYSYTAEIVVLNDNTILIGGGFKEYNSNPITNIAKLNSDGTLNTSFTSYITEVDKCVYAIAVQSDGNIIVAGDFIYYQSELVGGIVRLSNNGELDSTFSNNYGFLGDYCIYSIALQSDGKILVGGHFTNYNGITVTNLMRLNSDGSLDTSFVGSGSIMNENGNDIYVIKVDSGNRIYVGGSFTNFSGTGKNGIVRLNSDGSIDNFFSTSGLQGNYFSVKDIAIQSDGKIVIGGDFTSYEGTLISNLARLNPDGSLDTTFNTGRGPNYSVEKIFIPDNNWIYIGGCFTEYNGVQIYNMARIKQ
ncbi:MAG: hypothetical protein ACP5QT_04955 [Brevinematia bacterium]